MTLVYINFISYHGPFDIGDLRSISSIGHIHRTPKGKAYLAKYPHYKAQFVFSYVVAMWTLAVLMILKCISKNAESAVLFCV